MCKGGLEMFETTALSGVFSGTLRGTETFLEMIDRETAEFVRAVEQERIAKEEKGIKL